MPWLGAAALALLWLSGPASADWRLPTEGPLATDRPGNGNAATTVTRGHLNIESSALYAHPTSMDEHLLSFPVLLRLGVLERLELRAGSGLVGYAHVAGTDDAFATDTSVGLKVSALRMRGARPDLAFSADVFLPSGGGPFTSGAAVPELRALAAWALPADLGLLINLGADVPEDTGGQRYARALYVVNASYSPPVMEGRLTGFAEVFARHGLGDGREQIVQLDWGASWLLGDDLQLDFFFQHGLTSDAPDLQLSVGFSARI